jgi:hypothetical protein
MPRRPVHALGDVAIDERDQLDLIVTGQHRQQAVAVTAPQPTTMSRRRRTLDGSGEAEDVRIVNVQQAQAWPSSTES